MGKFEPTEPYITLSHCWGRHTEDIPKLRRDNFESLTCGIEPNTLPATFQDAVVVARRTGIRFIWIDCLCIFQDSTEDWVIESARMESIYGNAYFNIGATASDNPLGGLFQSRRDELIWPQPFMLDFGDGSSRECVASTISELAFDFSATPLGRRAWVVQERLLARRMIHLGADQLRWECCEDNACEQYPESVPSFLLLRSKNTITLPQNREKSKVRNSFVARFNKQSPSRHELLYLWSNMVEIYTHGRLSHEEGKFIAVQGLAKHFANSGLGTYHAGLWAVSLDRQLMWRPNTKDGASVRAALQRKIAPSWSWASIDGPVYMNRDVRHMRRLFKILDVQITPEDPKNPMGRVEDGFLRARGYVYRILYKHVSSHLRPLDFGSLHLNGREISVSVYLDNQCLNESPDARAVFILPLGSSITGDYIEGLVIERTHHSANESHILPLQFKRIGWFSAL